jgi:hypothetical protein
MCYRMTPSNHCTPIPRTYQRVLWTCNTARRHNHCHTADCAVTPSRINTCMRATNGDTMQSEVLTMTKQWFLLLAAMTIFGCSDLAEAISGSCRGNQSLAGVTVNVCTESPSLTVSNQGTLNTACRSGSLGSVASTWVMGQDCATAGRAGGCRRVVNGVDAISWVYTTSSPQTTLAIRNFCTSIQATYQAP